MTSGSYKSFKSLKPSISVPSVMDRYIITEMILPFLFGVGAFSSLAVSIDTVFDLVRRMVESGLPLGVAVNVFLLRLPAFIVLAFPMSVLFATLMTYSRLSSDSEVIALRSSGVSIYRLVLPAIILSFAVTGMTFLFNEQFVPAANYQASVTLNRALKSEEPVFRERNIFYPEYQEIKQANGKDLKILMRLFYADQFDGNQMKGLTIVDRSQEGLNQIIVSESAKWNTKQNTWDFFNGTIYLIAADSSYRNIVRFEHQQIQLPRAPLDLAERNRDSSQMNIVQVREQLEIMRMSGDEQEIRRLRLRIQQKIALPFACVVLGLFGAALGTRPQRTGRATSFGISSTLR